MEIRKDSRLVTIQLTICFILPSFCHGLSVSIALLNYGSNYPLFLFFSFFLSMYLLNNIFVFLLYYFKGTITGLFLETSVFLSLD